jgi:hypothetical protein
VKKSWIKCKDTLPVFSDDYLTCNANGSIAVTRFWDDQFAKDFNIQYNRTGKKVIKNWVEWNNPDDGWWQPVDDPIVYWQPLEWPEEFDKL